jgi:CPA1 family monovalent cation:H+ antiporter
MIHNIEGAVALLAAVAALALLARRVPMIPFPIVLVLGGLLLGLIPGLPRFVLSPDLVFLFFLPPLLYPAALFTPWRDFRANARPIGMLAVGLVLFTTLAVGFLAQYLLPDFTLAAGIVLGAIISPPDAIAANAIAERLHLPRRIVTILEGESLVNDATALVLYRFGVATIVTGQFSLSHAGGRFLVVGLGGILLGLAVGMATGWVIKLLDDPPIEITLSLLTPFAAYLLCERLEVSGVLAVVTAGLYHGWRAPEFTTSRMRLQAAPVWQMLEFILNGFVFLLIGLQLPEVTRGLGGNSPGTLVWYALVISVAVIAIRIIWVIPAAYLPRLLSRRIRERDPLPPWQHIAIVGWAGIRGVVSLAAAMALPLENGNGSPFPGRNLILFLTFVVILVTLVVQGLSLPLLIRKLGVVDDGAAELEERTARLKANEAALARVNELDAAQAISSDVINRMRVEYQDRIRQLQVCEPDQDASSSHLYSTEFERLARETLQVERKTLLQLRNENVINDQVLRRVQRDIDLAEVRLFRREG